MDWNQDGKLDIISGCYWTDGEDGAHMQILLGKGKNNFAKAKRMKNADDEPLQNDSAGSDADMRIICTQQHAVDYDNDGDLDLVVGCFGPEFFLYTNNADEENGENIISPKVTELPIKSNGHHSAPHLVDWDGDGDLDLLSGRSGGGVIWFENVGTRAEPKWAEKPTELVARSESARQRADGEIQMGTATRVWATDWNKDGILDLLVGDMTTVFQPAKGISEEEMAEKEAEHAEKMAEISKKLAAIYEDEESQGEDGEYTKVAYEKMEPLHDEMMKLHEAQSEFMQSNMTGHVWVLIRKANNVKP